MKRRLLYLVIALSTVPLGLVARSMRRDADEETVLGFILTYLADTLWAVMFFFLFAAALVRWRALSLAALTLAFTILIEVSQLYQGEPLAALRRFAPTRFLLGNSFLWSDVICLCVGTALAGALHHLIRDRKSIESCRMV